MTLLISSLCQNYIIFAYVYWLLSLSSDKSSHIIPDKGNPDNTTCHFHKSIYRSEHSSDELGVNSKTKAKRQKKARWHYISFAVLFWQRQRCTRRTLKHKPKELTFPSTNHSYREINLECSKKPHQLTQTELDRNLWATSMGPGRKQACVLQMLGRRVEATAKFLHAIWRQIQNF